MGCKRDTFHERPDTSSRKLWTGSTADFLRLVQQSTCLSDNRKRIAPHWISTLHPMRILLLPVECGQALSIDEPGC